MSYIILFISILVLNLTACETLQNPTTSTILLKGLFDKVGFSGELSGTIADIMGTELALQLTKEEQRRAIEAQTKVLNAEEIGVEERWMSDENPGVGGASVADREYIAKNGQTCRVTTVSTRGPNGEVAKKRQDWCKDESGSWAPVV